MNKINNQLLFPMIMAIAMILFSCADADENIRVEKIKFEKEAYSVMVDGIIFIKTYLSPKEAMSRELSWTSSNPEIATVMRGEVIGVKDGETTITASADGNSVSCKVQVISKKVPVIDVRFEKNELVITEEEKTILPVLFEPNNATDQRIIWTSEDESVSTVDTQGEITAVKEGETYIIAKSVDGGKIISTKVIVERKGKVTGVILDTETLTLPIGDSHTLVATVLPLDAVNKNVQWSSDNEAVATVDNNGTVHAVAKGNANITVTTEDGARTAVCKVTVSLVYRDNFDRPNTGLTNQSSVIGKDWQINNGQFEIFNNYLRTIKGGTPSQSVILNKSNDAVMQNIDGSFVFKIDITHNIVGWGGVVFNAQDDNSYYVLRFNSGSSALQFLATQTNGASWGVLSIQQLRVQPALGTGTTYRMTIRSNEPGKYHVLITDPSETTIIGEMNLTDNRNFLFGNGYAGIWSQSDGIMYDNFYVETK